MDKPKNYKSEFAKFVNINGEWKYYETEQDYIDLLNEEIERLNNIIKEVREIFKYYGNKEDIVGYSNYIIIGEDLLKILEILDKENKQ